MNCGEARPLVQAYVDGELDIAKSLEVEAHCIHWIKSGMSYWAVSSVSADELGRFAQLVRVEGNPPALMPGR